jgi:hypothetical protein
LSPSVFGATFIGFALAGFLGSFTSKKLCERFSSDALINMGAKISLAGTSLFTLSIFGATLLELSSPLIALFTVLFMMVTNFATGLIIPSALSSALVNYRDTTGAASAYLGFFYMTVISLFTLGIGLLHTQSLYVMPLYFFGCSCILWVVYKTLVQTKTQEVAHIA